MESKWKPVGMKRYSADKVTCTLETPSGELYDYMVHYRPDHIQIVPYKAPIIKLHGFAMTIGDIPDEMKNENYVLIECPLLAFKYPRSLPHNTAKREQILTKVHMEGRQEFRDNLLEATKRRKLATETSSKQSEDESPTTINILAERNSWRSKEELEFLHRRADELFQLFMSLLKKVEESHYARRSREQKMAQDTDREKPNREENEGQCKGPDPSSQAKAKVEGYTQLSEDKQIYYLKTPCGKLYEYMIHNRGDHWLLLPFKAPIIKGDGFVITIGDIPDEVKTEDWLIVECPLPAVKYPILLPGDGAARAIIIDKAHKECVQEFKANLREAIKGAKMATLCSSEQPKDAPPTTINILEMGAVNGRQMEENLVMGQALAEQLKLLMSVVGDLESHFARLLREQKVAQDVDREKPNREDNEGQRKGPDPSSQAKAKVEGYTQLSEDKQIYYQKTPCGKLYEYMVHNRGDHWLLLPYKAPIIKGDGFVITIGDIPDEVKTEDWLIAECPLPAIKYPILLPGNAAAREIIIDKARKECMQEFKANLREAIKGAKMATLCSSEQPKDAPPTTINILEMGAVNGRQMEENLVMGQALAEQLKLLMSVVGDLESHFARLLREQKMAQDADPEKPNREENEGQRKGPDPSSGLELGKGVELMSDCF